MGCTLGSTANTVSPISPREDEATPASLTARPMPVVLVSVMPSKSYGAKGRAKQYSHSSNDLSKALYSAQKFGAQYAWFNPRVKGNSRERTWGIWPMTMKGPNDRTNTAMMEFARLRKLLIWK